MASSVTTPAQQNAKNVCQRRKAFGVFINIFTSMETDQSLVWVLELIAPGTRAARIYALTTTDTLDRVLSSVSGHAFAGELRASA